MSIDRMTDLKVGIGSRNINKDIVYKDLSYQIVGSAFKVSNELGYGFPEKIYQDALAKELITAGIPFAREVHIPILYKGEKLAAYFADFIVEDKIILELKSVPKLQYSYFKQVLPYLKSSGKKLGILLYFTRNGVRYRRVLNPDV